MAKTKLELRKRRKTRIRKKLSGTSERPRLTVFRSNRHVYVQVIDDSENRVIASACTLGAVNRASVEGLKKIDQAKKIGIKIAQLCVSNGVKHVAFDRNGYQYHGRVKALADAAREGGLSF